MHMKGYAGGLVRYGERICLHVGRLGFSFVLCFRVLALRRWGLSVTVAQVGSPDDTGSQLH